ncbi:MAG TPA: cyclopropane-fatty-acyl-phospholipid synthase family protein [Bryobacteraceae bacterium]|nr:cyclopropane-fatty-acyl-phospholipid synthase family protein [Bryobacteraceae bacterium]
MQNRSSLLGQRLLRRIFEGIGEPPIRLVLEDQSFSPLNVSPVATVIIPDLRTLAGLMLDPEVAFGEAYTEGRIRIEGDLVRFLEATYRSMAAAPARRSWYARLASRWMDWRQDNTPGGSRHNIHRHYDLGNDFYKLWLDQELVYTCAYFPSPSATLEEAQRAKMDYVCRKLRLQPGETVVEAGCGWGALALHMARNYGVSVKAFNVSREQILFARERAQAERLDHQVEFIEDDYRSISGKFDAFVSVGMLEHVGLDHYAELGRIIHRSVGDTGRGLLHSLGRSHPAPLSRWIRRRIFPGAYIPTLREAAEVLEPWDYAIQDVENLRLHYAKTMEHWLERFENSRRQVEAMYDSGFVRAWRLYLAGSLAAFRTGTLQLFQIVFTGSRCQPIWWTRAPLYSDAKAEIGKATWTHAMS